MTLIRLDEFGQPMRLLPAKKSYRFGPIFLLLILALEFPSVFASQAAKKVGGNPPSQADQRSLSIREDFHLKLRLSSDVNAPASTKVAAKLLGNDFELALFQHQVEIQGFKPRGSKGLIRGARLGARVHAAQRFEGRFVPGLHPKTHACDPRLL